MRSLSLFGAVVSCSFLALAVACGDDTGVVSVDGGADGALADVTPKAEAGSPSPDGSASDACSADDLCFDVQAVRPGTTPMSGRLILAWFQLNDDGPDPAPKIGYEKPFSGTETRLAIPIAQVALPDEANLYCHRQCVDEATCPCLTEPKVGIGLVFVVPDGADGGVRGSIGRALMAVAYSDKAFKPAPPVQDGIYSANERLFPDGIEQGVRGYALVRPDGGSFDRLGVAPLGSVFTLPVCDTTDQAVCEPKGPNLS